MSRLSYFQQKALGRLQQQERTNEATTAKKTAHTMMPHYMEITNIG